MTPSFPYLEAKWHLKRRPRLQIKPLKEKLQALDSRGAYEWEYYELSGTLDDGHFLIPANYYDGQSHLLSSSIWKFHPEQRLFIPTHQHLATHGARDWCHFKFVCVMHATFTFSHCQNTLYIRVTSPILS